MPISGFLIVMAILGGWDLGIGHCQCVEAPQLTERPSQSPAKLAILLVRAYEHGRPHTSAVP